MTTVLTRALARVLAPQLDAQTLSFAASGAASVHLWDANQALAKAASGAIENAVTQALTHVNLVVKNNPGKTMAEILGRADVQQALTEPFLAAQSAVETAIRQAWDSGVDTGWESARGELSALGKTLGDAPELPTATRDSILTDASVNAASARARFNEALLSPDPVPTAAKVAVDLQRRATLGVDASGQSGMNQAKEAAFATFEGVEKMWLAHIDAKTCQWCRWLHGQTVPLGEAFAVPGGSPKVYGGTLTGPPRHPNCRCQLVPHMAEASKAAQLQAAALVTGAANDEAPPPAVTAEAIRSIPTSKAKSVLAWLVRWVLGG